MSTLYPLITALKRPLSFSGSTLLSLSKINISLSPNLNGSNSDCSSERDARSCNYASGSSFLRRSDIFTLWLERS